MANFLVQSLNPLSIAIYFVLLGMVYPWSCSEDAVAVPVDVELMSGDWYEVARAPKSDVPACVKVFAPSSIEKDEYILELDYVNNVNKGWKRVQENLTFPWNNDTQNGLFKQTYRGEDIEITVDFKFMGTYDNFSVVCGYSGVAAGISMIRLLSRNETVDAALISTFNKFLQSQGIDSSQITWVEQGGRCNSSSYLSSPAVTVLFAILMALVPKLTNKNY